MESTPHYALAILQQKSRDASARSMSSTAYHDAVSLGLDAAGVWRCVQALVSADFYKTMASTDRPGLHQDVYRPRFQNLRLYVKLQLLKDGQHAHVISFKEDMNR